MNKFKASIKLQSFRAVFLVSAFSDVNKKKKCIYKNPVERKILNSNHP